MMGVLGIEFTLIFMIIKNVSSNFFFFKVHQAREAGVIGQLVEEKPSVTTAGSMPAVLNVHSNNENII